MEKEKFIEILKQLGIEISELQMNQFDLYYETLIEWNQFMNLTGITEYEDVLIKHFADSVAINKAIENLNITQNESTFFNSELKIIDVGTGAGFPGIPLKIAFPEIKVCLLDSLNKRVKFLDEVIQKLQLTNIHAVHGRAEEFARNADYREQYGLAVSRAVANLASLTEYCLPYVKKGGYFIAYKSGDINEEAANAKKAIGILGGEIVDIYKFIIPQTDIERSFVVIRKNERTPKKYPRKAGLPTKEPIQ
jgi:16S rRNA (guanine527-N7)-methyltransferase